MTVKRVFVRRMTTSREGPTKYEHFVSAENADAEIIDFWMHHEPEHALYGATELAQFLGLEVEPLLIDGKPVELDHISLLMLDVRRKR